MAQTTGSSKVGKNSAREKPCLVFDLENVAFASAQLIYTALAERLKTKDITLTTAVFRRLCPAHPTARNLERILVTAGLTKGDIQKMAEECLQSIDKHLQAAKPAPKILKLLQEADRQGIAIGALTAQTETTVEKLLEALSLKTKPVVQYAAGTNGFASAADWRALANKLDAEPLQCVALVHNAAGVRAVLGAGMHCVAVPDEHHEWQDFAGADMVVESNADLALADILALIAPGKK